MAPLAPNPGDTRQGGGNLVPQPQNNMNPFMPGFPGGQQVMFGGEAMGTVPDFSMIPGFGGQQNPGSGFNSNWALAGLEFPGAQANPTQASGQVLNALRKDLQKAGFGSEASFMLSSLIQNGMLQDPFALNSLAGIMGQAPQDFGSLAQFAGNQVGGFQGFNNQAFQNLIGTAQGQAGGTKQDIINNFMRLIGQAQSETGQFDQQAAGNFAKMLSGTNADWNALLDQASQNFGNVAGQSNQQFGGLLQQLQQFMQSGSGYNPQVAQALFAQMQPQISQQERDIAERFGSQGLASSSSGALGMADYLGQVNANQQATNANLYQQSIQNFLAAQGLAGQDVQAMLGVDLGAAQGLTQAQTAAAAGKSQGEMFAAQGLTNAQQAAMQTLVGAQTAGAQGISAGELSILQNLLGTELGATQGMTSNDLSAMQTLLGTDSQAMQNMFGTELGATSEFGNIFQGGMNDILGILSSTKRQKGGGFLGGLGSLLGGLGGGSGISDLLSFIPGL